MIILSDGFLTRCFIKNRVNLRDDTIFYFEEEFITGVQPVIIKSER